jgi:hypothetical protein
MSQCCFSDLTGTRHSQDNPPFLDGVDLSFLPLLVSGPFSWTPSFRRTRFITCSLYRKIIRNRIVHSDVVRVDLSSSYMGSSGRPVLPRLRRLRFLLAAFGFLLPLFECRSADSTWGASSVEVWLCSVSIASLGKWMLSRASESELNSALVRGAKWLTGRHRRLTAGALDWNSLSDGSSHPPLAWQRPTMAATVASVFADNQLVGSASSTLSSVSSSRVSGSIKLAKPSAG